MRYGRVTDRKPDSADPPLTPRYHIAATFRGFPGTELDTHEMPITASWAVVTHREIFSKSYCSKFKSICIYHFPIDLDQQTNSVRLVLNQSENGKYNLISASYKKFSRKKQFRVRKSCPR